MWWWCGLGNMLGGTKAAVNMGMSHKGNLNTCVLSGKLAILIESQCFLDTDQLG